MNNFVLVTTITPKDSHKDLLQARKQVVDSILESGLIPVIVSGDMDKNITDKIYEKVSGVVLPGGLDIDPSLYNEERISHTDTSDHLRDSLEIDIAKRCLLDKKPILGICRGMQVLWVANGGKLHQHLPLITNEIHGSAEPAYSLLYEEKFHHKIKVNEQTKLYEMVKPLLDDKNEITIPSMHHQGVNLDSKTNFIVSASSKDGIVEGIEMDTNKHPFYLGIQGHPEAWIISDKENEVKLPKLIFSSFAKAVEDYSASGEIS